MDNSAPQGPEKPQDPSCGTPNGDATNPAHAVWSVVSTWFGAAREKAGELVTLARAQLGGLSTEAIRQAQAAGQYGTELLSAAADTGLRTADSGLRALHQDPEKKEGIPTQVGRFVLDFVPILRNTPAYAAARQRYEAAGKIECEMEREKEREAARRDCLFVCLNLGIDFATLGTAGILRKLAGRADKLITALAVFKRVGTAAQLQGLDFMDPLLSGLMTIPRVRAAMEILVAWSPTAIDEIAKATAHDPESPASGAGT